MPTADEVNAGRRGQPRADIQNLDARVAEATSAMAAAAAVTVPPVAAGATPTKAEYDALRQAVLDLKAALTIA